MYNTTLRVFLGLLLAFSLEACPMPQPDGCTPGATRCSPQGMPQECSVTQRWQHGAMQVPCSEYGRNIVCAIVRGQFGSEQRAACVPQSEVSDGGR